MFVRVFRPWSKLGSLRMICHHRAAGDHHLGVLVIHPERRGPQKDVSQRHDCRR